MKHTHARVTMLSIFLAGGLAMLLTGSSHGEEKSPRFVVPGFEEQISQIEGIFDLHYPAAGPKSTMWEEWLSMSSLWPATDRLAAMRQEWKNALLSRIFEPDGYVATHQHPSIAHQHGWPFPFYRQSGDTWGWHFQLPPIGKEWHASPVSTEEGWKFEGLQSKGVVEGCWTLELSDREAAVVTPAMDADSFCSPFLQLRWKAKGLGDAKPYVEWIHASTEEFTSAKRFYFDPVESDSLAYTMIPVFEHPLWEGRIKQLRIGFDPQTLPSTVGIDSLFTQFDTRHDINNSSFILGSDYYFRWTGDINFLRANIERMRTAMLYILSKYHLAERHVVLCDYVGHNGRSGYDVLPGNEKKYHFGQGVGSNYWDLLPFGHLDAYATNQCHAALLRLAAIEESIELHPEWNIPASGLRTDPDYLRGLAAKVRAEYQRLFWNYKTGRFNGCIDDTGQAHDYGLTFLNLEAIYYGLALPDQAGMILDWIEGKRLVEGDTSQGEDIYHWRFAPRATTKRNVEWYFWAWNSPETIPFGYQIQDGGAVLGFSYFDMMARLEVRGPDNAWQRLLAIADWFKEVQAEGGYRQYYSRPERGSMQGSGTAGGLGLDMEFFESVMVPQVLLYGFLGFEPATDGFFIHPSLPEQVKTLGIRGIAWRDLVLDVKAEKDRIEVVYRGHQDEPLSISLPEGRWGAVHKDPAGNVVPGGEAGAKGNVFVVQLADEGTLEFTR